jgi:acid phosphatase family membrane protein YuiD
MQDFGNILDNRVLFLALVACLIAQASKLLVELIRNRKVNLKVLVETGGMPSSHSALVAALATGVGLHDGWASSEFAIASIVAAIVMYDSQGVRQAAGKQAKILNQIIDEFFQGEHQFTESRLKELLGHTPFQVIVGSLFGVVVCLVGEWLLGDHSMTALLPTNGLR